MYLNIVYYDQYIIKNGENSLGEPGDLRDGVFVIVADNPAILLVKHNYGEKLWSLPGGGVKQGEIVITAAKRELLEETGIERVGENFKQIGLFTLMKRYGMVVLFQSLDWFGDPKADGKEIAECKFVSIDEINMLSEAGLIYPAQLNLITIFLKYRYHYTPIYGKLTNPPIIEFSEQQGE